MPAAVAVYTALSALNPRSVASTAVFAAAPQLIIPRVTGSGKYAIDSISATLNPVWSKNDTTLPAVSLPLFFFT